VRTPTARRSEALLDFLLEAIAVEETQPFPSRVLDRLRALVACETISYREWDPETQVDFALATDDPTTVCGVWRAYPAVRYDDPLAGGPGPAAMRSELPAHEWLGVPLTISDFRSDRAFRRGALYAEICRPLGVRAVMKVFLPTDGRTAAAFVFDSSAARFADSDRDTLGQLVPQLAQLHRNARARRTHAALTETAAAVDARFARLTARERVVLGRAAAGDTNATIAAALFLSVGTVRKHLEHVYEKLEVRNRAEATALYVSATALPAER
jgi:DNA-binding CsgD family transcriptional regulator